MQALFDTDAMLELLKGNPDIASTILHEGITSITYCQVSTAEIIAGVSNKKGLQDARKALTGYPQTGITEPAFEEALRLMLRYTLSHKLSLNDALIAATALYNSLPLLTLNSRDFRFINGLQLIPHQIKPKRGGWLFIS